MRLSKKKKSIGTFRVIIIAWICQGRISTDSPDSAFQYAYYGIGYIIILGSHQHPIKAGGI
jgi:hypothetical protein